METTKRRMSSEKLMVVPSIADGFRAALSALRSLDGKEGVSFHTFTLLNDRCARLRLKNLGKGMPESVVREEMEYLNIRVQGVTHLRYGNCGPYPAKDRLPTPTSLYQYQCITKDPAVKVEVNRFQRSVTRRLNDWRKDQWSHTLEPLDIEDQSLWRMTKRVLIVHTPSPLWPPQRDSPSRTLRKPQPSQTIWRLSFSR